MNEAERATACEPRTSPLQPVADVGLSPASSMRLYLINPSNPLVSILNVEESRWNRYRVWKPLGLMVIAGLTPQDWEVTIIDENLGVPDYSRLPRPDLVGITAFTSQAERAYELATRFRDTAVPVVIGGIHATMCLEEASVHVDTVVTGEAERVWAEVLEDARAGHLKPLYEGGFADLAEMSPARHDLLPQKYAFGSVQTTRGCPLHCSFCSVTAFNGSRFRQRPIKDVIEELETVSEDLVLIVDDNLIGTRREHQERAKDLFRAMIQANLEKNWVAQTTINVANDEELLTLAARYESDWNHGNAVHHAHNLLGRIELKRNRLGPAIEHLHEAGKTPGSPQLNSFGPNMLLARELLELGEREAVLLYFDLCRAWWAAILSQNRAWARSTSPRCRQVCPRFCRTEARSCCAPTSRRSATLFSYAVWASWYSCSQRARSPIEFCTCAIRKESPASRAIARLSLSDARAVA